MVAKQSSQRGFTLVEMAIVLVIIGLIIGGILKGQEIVDNARVKSQVSQVDSLKSAIATFVDEYNYYPGDDPNAVAQVNAAAGVIGDGDGFVGNSGVSAAVIDTAAAGNEMNMAWYHLQLARLISGIPVPAAPTPTSPYNNAGKLAGTYLWFGDFSWNAAVVNKMIRIQGNNSTAAATVAPNVNSPGVRTADAAQIDLKYDDGVPSSGQILAATYSAATNCCLATAGGGATACTTANDVYGLTGTGSTAAQYCGLLWLIE